MTAGRWPVEVVGLVPAAGEARRIAPLPVSKELFPLGFRPGPDGTLRPQVVSAHLLGHFAGAGIERALFLIRDGKWDIPHYFGTGRGHAPTLLAGPSGPTPPGPPPVDVGLDLGYLVVDPPLGVGYSLDRAHGHVRGAVCATGFPDILFGPPDTYATLLSALFASDADVVVNLVAMPDPSKATMVDHVDGRVRGFIERPVQTALTDSYCAVVWRPTFGAFLHELVAGLEQARPRALRAPSCPSA